MRLFGRSRSARGVPGRFSGAWLVKRSMAAEFKRLGADIQDIVLEFLMRSAINVICQTLDCDPIMVFPYIESKFEYQLRQE